MGTHHVYSGKLVGQLFLVALVALCCGGCGKTASQGGPAFEPAGPEPCVVHSDGVAGESDEGTVTICDEPGADMAETGVLGYSDPTVTEAVSTPSVPEDEGTPEQEGNKGDNESGTMTPWMANWGEDRVQMIDEGSNGETNEGLESEGNHEGMYEETPCTPDVTQEEYTPKPTGDMEDEYTPEPTGDGNDEGSAVGTQ
jgi:hypothetical protein